jgi:hypothetical protein
LGQKLLDLFRWPDHRIGVPVTGFGAQVSQLVVPEDVGQRSGFPEIPSFELLASDPYQRVFASAVPSQRSQSVLQPSTIAPIIVPQHHEAHARLPPRTELLRNALLEILLAFVGNA